MDYPTIGGELLQRPYDVNSWFCAGILYRITEGRLEFLTMISRPKVSQDSSLAQLKFPGGTNENKPDFDPEVTLVREFFDEVGVLVRKYSLIHRHPRFDRKGNINHRQYFSLIHEAEGEMRTSVMWDSKELLEAPQWREVGWGLYNEFFYSHQMALSKAAAILGYPIPGVELR